MPPSWSLNNSSFTSLPVAPRYGGRPRSIEDTNISLETDLGARFVYSMYSRNTYELTFRCSGADLDSFLALHVAVGGESNAFYYSPSGDGAMDSVYVRKEAGFDPVELDQPSLGEPMFDYVLRMKQELV